MTVEVGKTYSDDYRLDKDFTLKASCTAQLKEGTSVIDPVFIIHTLSALDINYVKCAAFGRHYYINNIVAAPGERLELHCHVDVLSSFKSGIRSCTGIVDKQQNMSNASRYIDDGSYVMESRDRIESYNFNNGFSSSAHILITAGG